MTALVHSRRVDASVNVWAFWKQFVTVQRWNDSTKRQIKAFMRKRTWSILREMLWLDPLLCSHKSSSTAASRFLVNAMPLLFPERIFLFEVANRSVTHMHL